MISQPPAFRGVGVTPPPGGRMVRDGGMVLLEAALAIPLLVAVALAGLGVARLAVDEIAVTAAARDAAVASARGVPDQAVAADIARRVPGAVTEIRRGGDEVQVRVRSTSPTLRRLGTHPISHEAVAIAVREPGS